MIDRPSRDKLAEALRQYVSGRITNDTLDDIKVDIGSSVVLINDIEEELRLPNGGSSKPYVALSHISSESFTISDSMNTKIRTIYDARK
jgi:hypothetical protein